MICRLYHGGYIDIISKIIMALISKFQNFDLISFNEKKQQIYDKIPIFIFTRFPEHKNSETDEIELTISHREKPGQNFIHLNIKANLLFKCFRCLEIMNTEVTIDQSYELVYQFTESDRHTIESIQIKLTDDFDLLEFIEDEMLLAIPSSPKHDNNCI
ncbi:MAG: hypothetical protein RIQ57_877 [Pseudomonadota bacterium]